MIRKSSVCAALVAAAVWAAIGHAADRPQGQELALGPDNVKWVPCGVPQFPGCEAALLHGDPGKGPYSMYVRIPAGEAFPPHWHTNSHYLVGVQGTLTFNYKDGSVVTLSPGTFGYWPGNEMMQGRCGNDGPCVYYDHQSSFGDVHFPAHNADADGHAKHE